MRNVSRLGLLCAAVVALLLLGAAAPLTAGESPAEAPKPDAPTPEGGEVKPALTPEEQAAQDLLKRYKVELEVQKDQKRFLATRHVEVAQAHFNNQAWEDARRHFEKALELDPMNKEAQEGLRKTQSMLGVATQRFGDLAADYARQRAIALDVQKTELNNMLGAAKALFEKGQFVDAVEQFTRVSAKAKYLSPNIDVGKTVAEAEVYIQRSMMGIEEKRKREAAEHLKRAEDEAKDLRERREKLFDERNQALYRQALTLFEQKRYEECRKICDEILYREPANGPAATLLESATSASRNQLIDKAIKERRVEIERHWQETRAYCVPYTEVRPYMPRDRFEQVRSRKEPTAIGGGEIVEQPWEQRIKDAMGKKISFDFVETPLQDVITFISSLADVTIVLDTEAVKDEPRNVTLRVNDMRLESALNWVLKLVGLKYGLKDEAIFVSKAERIYDKPVLRMYDVTDLTIDIKNFQGRQQALASDGGYSSTGAGGGGGTSGGGDSIGEDFFGSSDDENKEEEKLTGESLVEFIKRTIAPGTWTDDEGGAGGAAKGGF